MSKIVWDDIGEKIAETGVKNGVLYPMAAGAYTAGVAWNGLTSVNEAPTGAEPSPFYADNSKYLEIMSEEEFAGTIGCYTYPDEFKLCIGEASLHAGVSVGQQRHIPFGFCYRTEIVNDTEGMDYGYKLHLVYNSLAGVSARDHTTVNETPELEEMSFDFSATKVPVTGAKPTAHFIIDSTKIPVGSAANLAALELILFGSESVDPRLPLPDEIAALFASAAPAAIALDTIVPADDDPSIAVNSTIVITFNNQISREAIVVTEADGTIVAGAKTWDVSKKTFTFTPSVPLTAGTVYLVTVGGVVDIYGQTLAAAVKNFTTAD